MLQSLRDAGVAQLVEHQPSKLNVVGSRPISRSTSILYDSDPPLRSDMNRGTWK
jgi:hypothetical protein